MAVVGHLVLFAVPRALAPLSVITRGVLAVPLVAVVHLVLFTVPCALAPLSVITRGVLAVPLVAVGHLVLFAVPRTLAPAFCDNARCACSAFWLLGTVSRGLCSPSYVLWCCG